MSTSQAAIVETISKHQLRGLPSRKAPAAERLNKIRDLASALMDEAKSLDHENGLAETSATIENLNLKSRLDFFEEVRRYEVRLISRALEVTGGNQARAARLLGLGTTTLNYKIKAYEITTTA
ncbi:MAG TPA: helix-turn-helix domain-containing protein [Pyrinomonadaceae bacterium]|jgi:DNA-binding NtrC family response regulator